MPAYCQAKATIAAGIIRPITNKETKTILITAWANLRLFMSFSFLLFLITLPMLLELQTNVKSLEYNTSKTLNTKVKQQNKTKQLQ